ncbi:MAG: hypothetical protein ACREUY_08565 [Burkholderiales bacterium]
MPRISVLLFLLSSLSAHAEDVNICYNYDCAESRMVRFSESQLANAGSLFRGLHDGAEEREVVAEAVGLLARYAGEQSPIWRDKAKDNDGGVDGRMDSADHSKNTTAYLKILEGRGWLKFHRVQSRVVRGATKPHWAARIVDIRTGQQYAVDTWWFDNGKPAAIFRLDDWLKGARPGG